MNAFEVIKNARLTEKGTRQGEKYNQYTVVADRRANKTEIRQAVQEDLGAADRREKTEGIAADPHGPRRQPRPACVR